MEVKMLIAVTCWNNLFQLFNKRIHTLLGLVVSCFGTSTKDGPVSLFLQRSSTTTT